MKKFTLTFTFVILLSSLLQATTYLTSGLGGSWESPHSWVLAKTGEQPATAPTEHDDVIIAHYLTHQPSADYIHFGKLTIAAGGIYELLPGGGKAANFIFAGKTLKVAGTLFSGGRITLEGHSEMVISAASICWIGGDLVMNNSGGLFNQNRTCGAFSVLGGLRMEAPTAFIVGNGLITVQGTLSTSWTGDQESTFDAVASRTQQGINFYTHEHCSEKKAFLSGTDAELSYGVEWEHFEAIGLRREVHLSWSTLKEPFTLDFTLERSYDGQSFEIVADVTAEGEATYGGAYDFTDTLDREHDGSVYYRIRQNGLDGGISYSPLRTVKPPVLAPASMEVYPNPIRTGQAFTMQAEGFSPDQLATMTVCTLNGARVSQEPVAIQIDGSARLSRPANMRAGVYMLVLQQGETKQVSRLIVY